MTPHAKSFILNQSDKIFDQPGIPGLGRPFHRILYIFSWTKRIQNSIKNSFLGTPRFHRRKQSTPGSNQSLIGDSDCESYMSNSTSTDSEKKSWFKDVWNSVNQETQYSIIMDEQNPQKVKNQLIQVRSQIDR